MTNNYQWHHFYFSVLFIELNLRFSQTHKLALLPTLYSHLQSLVNVKLDIRGHKRITFQGFRLHWSSSFLMVQLNKVGNINILVLWTVDENLCSCFCVITQSWQIWHFVLLRSKDQNKFSKRFTSSWDWTPNPRTVAPLVFTLSCLDNWANLTLLVRLKSLYSHAILILVESSKSPKVNCTNTSEVKFSSINTCQVSSVVKKWECKHKSCHSPRVAGSISIGGKLFCWIHFTLHYEAIQKYRICQLYVITEKHDCIFSLGSLSVKQSS